MVNFMKRNNNTFGSIYYNKQRDNWIYEYYETDSITGEKKDLENLLKRKKKLKNMYLNIRYKNIQKHISRIRVLL